MGRAAESVPRRALDRAVVVTTDWPPIADDPYIFVTVGTDHHPFHRLMQWVDKWTATNGHIRLAVQSGTSIPPTAPHRPELDYHDLLKAIEESLGTVSHGGPATITEIRQSGRIPIVVPRRAKFGEHVDDHQLLFCQRIAADGLIRLVDTEDQFEQAIHDLLENPELFRHTPDQNARIAQTLDTFRSLIAKIIPAGDPIQA